MFLKHKVLRRIYGPERGRSGGRAGEGCIMRSFIT
jgi:hypothetical protein